jgi:hypothetical protein
MPPDLETPSLRSPVTIEEPAPSVPLPDAVSPPEAGRGGLRHWYLFWPVVVYVALRGLTLIGITITNAFIHHDRLYRELYRWDDKWFVKAATRGYPSQLPMHYGHVASNTIAFFPVFPLAIRVLADITSISPVPVAIVISGVTGLTAVLAVGMLARHFAGAEKATRAALLFVVFPGTFVFSMGYSEGIIITCVAFGLLALLRGQWWLAGALGLVATAASPVALAFVISCAWCSGRAILRDRTWRSLVAPLLAPVGFAAYMLYLWAHTGHLNAWRLTERGGWKSYPSLAYPVHILTTFIFNPVRPTITGQILFAGTIVTVIAAVIAIQERQPAPVLIYGLLVAAFVAISAPVGLRPRMIMVAFPLIIAVGTRLRGRAYAWVFAASTCALIAMTYLEMFSMHVFP